MALVSRSGVDGNSSGGHRRPADRRFAKLGVLRRLIGRKCVCSATLAQSIPLASACFRRRGYLPLRQKASGLAGQRGVQLLWGSSSVFCTAECCAESSAGR
jgi:hypothetical protein